MPAETHQQRGVSPVTALADVGIDNDLALFHLGDAVAEEYGERTVGELDLDEPGRTWVCLGLGHGTRGEADKPTLARVIDLTGRSRIAKNGSAAGGLGCE